MWKRIAVFGAGVVLALLFMLSPAGAQVSQQVLALLVRDNTWTGLQSINVDVDGSGGLRLVDGAPTPTSNRLYSLGGVLFWNGSAIQTASAGAGTVTSVGLTVPSFLSVTGSPITGAGTLAVDLTTQSANRVLAGPTSGAASAPTFRALVDDDLPSIVTIGCTDCITWTSVAKAGSSLAHLTTRSASDLSSGTLADARFPAVLPAVSGINLTNLPASAFTGGLPVTSMPALTGDVTTTAGAVATTLATSGVTAGSYTNATITVDAKGRLTAASTGASAIAHNVLSASHSDTLAAAVAEGSLIIGNATPKWSSLAIGAVGTFLRSNGTTASWSTDGSTLTGISASAITGGVIPVAQGGTGISTLPTNGQLLIGVTATNLYQAGTLTGTSNQITVGLGAGSITLSTPQDLHTGATPQFTRLGLGNVADGAYSLYVKGAATVLVDDGNSSTADTIDWSSGNVHKSTLTGNCTYTFSNPATPLGDLTLLLLQDATGSRLATWPGSVRWKGGSAPTLTTTANKYDLIRCQHDGTNYLCEADLNF